MKKKIRVLHLGEKSLKEEFSANDWDLLDWTSINVEKTTQQEIDDLLKKTQKPFDAVLCTEKIDEEVIKALENLIDVYGIIIDCNLKDEVSDTFKKKKIPYFIDTRQARNVIDEIKNNFFSGQMGSKLHTNTIHVNQKFKGQNKVLGESYLMLEGSYDVIKRQPLLMWQRNIGMYGRSKKIWLEFVKDPTVEISLTLLKIREGGSEVMERCTYSQEEVKRGIEVPYENNIGYLSVFLSAKGQGVLRVGPLHFRDTRYQYGEYILGGKKITDENNQELFYYFNPADLKPPLNVYFSGYRSAEGFEGFFMMKALGAPFLLITDPRLEGGSFYMGSSSLEDKLTDVIQKHLDYLGFSKEELVLSGLSMGTYGALYYASRLEPGHVIVGKPLVNVGDIAYNEQLVRPGGFPTSLDILKSLEGSLTKEAVENLNQRFWLQFSEGKFDATRFIVAYMMNDDYDVHAYKDITAHLSESEASIISKGIPGRHNDNSPAINEWFLSQYKRILREQFHRIKGIEL
ncbi:accessory Sec system protein Asp2 [Lactococcus sp. DD01]|uniref:accessory Sec system protein Asp2 n=1 Tax=Lactococcus sp. DD01 TaxID=1776443 RepID=UPI0007764859|nr:accessory Sec system protein Asp2 [Lactococcus sp. DD01]KXT59350.1 Accessory secretory protein Asp2 [Lactococcus sp. DD01]